MTPAPEPPIADGFAAAGTAVAHHPDSEWRGGRFGSLLLFLVVLAFAIAVLDALTLEQVGTFLHHDNLNATYPLRVLVSRSFVTGVPPLWNFWSHAGTPLATLFEPAAESPIVRLVSWGGIYSEASFTLEIVLVFCLGFAGFYLWTRDFTRPWVALLGAYAYTLSPCIVVQMPINIENAVSALMYPWIALGLRRLLTGHAIGTVYVAIGVWVSVTTGYLGVNVIAFQLLLLYALGEWWVHAPPTGEAPRPRMAALMQSLPHLGLAAALTAALLSFPLLESHTLYRYDFSQIRPSDFDPFSGTTSVASFVTLTFPNAMSTFAADADGGHIVLLFGGITILFFAVFALTRREARAWKIWLSFVATLAFASTLTPSSRIGPLLTDLIPFYRAVRFHCWMVSISLLLLVELGCVGIEQFVRLGTSRMRSALVAFLALAVLAATSELVVRHHSHPAFASVPPLAMRWQIYPVMLLAVTLLLARRWGLGSRQLAVVIFAAAVSEPILIRHQYAHLTRQPEHVMRLLNPSFVPAGNLRASSIGRNDQYFTQALTIRNYHPLVMPSVKRIVDRRQEDTYLRKVFYPASELTRPSSGTARVEITAIDSAGMRATISTTVPETFVWSVPFTSNWRLRLNGELRVPHASPEGLTELFLESGVSSVEFAYAPPYLSLCRWLRLLAILTLAFIAVRATLRLGSPWRSSVAERPHLSPSS